MTGRPRGDVALDELPDSFVPDHGRRLLALLRSRSSAVLRARCIALFTDATVVSTVSGDLLGRKAEHLTENEDRTLPRRQVLEGGDERELDGLALLERASGAA